MVRILLKHGASLKTANGIGGGTALHVACENGRIAIVQLLIEQGADVEARDWRGNTPLMTAADSVYAHVDAAEIARYLISQGADIHAKKPEGETALDIARRRGKDREKLIALLEEMEIQRVQQVSRLWAKARKGSGTSDVKDIILPLLGTSG